MDNRRAVGDCASDPPETGNPGGQITRRSVLRIDQGETPLGQYRWNNRPSTLYWSNPSLKPCQQGPILRGRLRQPRRRVPSNTTSSAGLL